MSAPDHGRDKDKVFDKSKVNKIDSKTISKEENKKKNQQQENSSENSIPDKVEKNDSEKAKIKKFLKNGSETYEILRKVNEYFEKNKIGKLIETISEEYKNNIDNYKIKEDFLQEQLIGIVRFIDAIFNKSQNPPENPNDEIIKIFSVDNSRIVALRKSLYLLIQKIEEEKKNDPAYKKLIDEKMIDKYFKDLKKEENIRKRSSYKKSRSHALKLISSFKHNSLSDTAYFTQLHEIIPYVPYLPKYTMFEFVLYIYGSLSSKGLLSETVPAYSYGAFLKKRSSNVKIRAVPLGELFWEEGFVLRKRDDSNLLSFEELHLATFVTDEQKQKELINKFSKHPQRIYLFYALSQNPFLADATIRKVEREVKKLDYYYPYDENVRDMIESIDNLFEKRIVNKNDHQENNQTIHTDKIKISYIASPFIEADELSEEIQRHKNLSLFAYTESIVHFLNYLNRNILDSNSTLLKNKHFQQYILCILNQIREDSYLCFYEEFYLETMVEKVYSKQFLDADSSPELKQFVSFLYIKTLTLRIINKLFNFSLENRYLFKRLVQKYDNILDFFYSEKKFGYGVYFDLRYQLRFSGLSVYTEYILLHIGAKISETIQVQNNSRLLQNVRHKYEIFYKHLSYEEEKLLSEHRLVFEKFDEYHFLQELVQLYPKTGLPSQISLEPINNNIQNFIENLENDLKLFREKKEIFDGCS